MSLNSGETLQPFKALNQLIFDSSGNLIGIQNDRAVGNDLRIGGGSGVDGTFATLIATTALKLNSGATFDLYNTADQTTNYERLRADWSGNVARLFTQAGGTGVVRGIAVAGGTYGGSSGTVTPFTVNSTFNQSGTAGYILADFNAVETATGSGTKLLQRWAVGGSTQAQMNAAGTLWLSYVAAIHNIGFTNSIGSANDVTLTRDAADTLALRRDTNAQTFRVYNTYTDGSNYERGRLEWNTNTFRIGTGGQAAGTGTARSVQLDSGSNVFIAAGGTTAQWFFSTTGLLANSDNTYDIGASGANRPRNIYAATNVICTSVIVGTTTVVGLPAAASAKARYFVSDSTVAAAGNFGNIVAGGGANIVPVYSDGTNWRIG